MSRFIRFIHIFFKRFATFLWLLLNELPDVFLFAE